MNESNLAPDPATSVSREELFSALFAHMIVQHSNMALICLGKKPHPENGELMQDIDSAKMLIDQLEMLEAKTKGNLNKREDSLLKQSLTSVRMAFVEVVDGAGLEPQAAAPSPAAAEAAPKAEPSRPAGGPPSTLSPGSPGGAPTEAESRKKFSKKY
jgi:hypothetical protein